MNRHVLAKVNYNPPHGNDVFYGPFTDMEYVDFKEWLESVVNPNWTFTIEPIMINKKVTDLFIELQEIERNRVNV